MQESLTPQSQFQQRRYDIDWVRNLALLLLILYHVGMYYVADWFWHIKSDEQSVLLQNFMVFSNLWRMCLLFFVSGMTLALIEGKFRSGQLFALRAKRLFIPLVFGMFFIIPIQVYYEFIDRGLITGGQLESNFWFFLLKYINVATDFLPEKQTVIGLVTWNHLWYLAYLFVYTLVFLAIRPLLLLIVNSKYFAKPSLIGFMLIANVYMLLAWVFIRPEFPTTYALTDDWWSHAKYFAFMIIGYFFASRVDIWSSVIQHRRVFVVLGSLCYLFIAIDRNGGFPFMADAFKNNLWVQFCYGAVVLCDVWCWILACIGYAGRYLNQNSKWLKYANQAVLPWYILHQSLTILFAANLTQFSLPAGLESIILIALTVLSCYLMFELIRRSSVLRFLFGLKSSN